VTPEQWGKVKDVLAIALDLAPVERANYLHHSCEGNDPLRRQVVRLLEREHAAGSNFLRQTALLEAATAVLPEPDNPWIGRRVGTYQIVEQIGVGGMGEVYRSFRADDQYRKEVALKVVRAGQDSQFVVARFRNERQVLASLDHPNIARLFDGGTTPEGLPYLVMELIDGQPLGKYCDQRQLSVSDRLRLFLQVCGAVQYAHQRLIIHRDIKPSNILVTADGTPKLLDFGIAKVLDSDLQWEVSRTLTAFRPLTPEYASPEQINGGEVTTASDVYSLGVILYNLLVGFGPYPVARDSKEFSSVICHLDPEKPSTTVSRARATNHPEQIDIEQIAIRRGSTPQKLQKQLNGDLDNIVLMALRKDPSRRYASAERFAEDIRCHLENLPVIARTDTVRYRTAKFIVRHKTGVAATLTIAALLIVSMVGISWEAHVARVQRVRAERRFQDIRELAKSLIFDVHDSIRDVPGTTNARRLIVAKALHYLAGLEPEARDDPALQRELAGGYKRIGDVQGNDYFTNLGDTDSALNSYKKAFSIRHAVWAQTGSIDDAIALAESLRLVSENQLFAGDLSAGLKNSRQAVELLEPIAERHPKDDKVLLELMVDYESVANILGGENSLSSLGDNSAALVIRHKQVEAAERLLRLKPDDDSVQGNYAIALTTWGDQLWQDGQIAAPLEQYLRAQSIFQAGSVHSRKAARMRYLLDLVYERLVLVHLAKTRVPVARKAARSALDISMQLSAADPRDIQAGVVVAEDEALVANVESRMGENQRATSRISKAMALVRRMAELSPQDIETQGSEAGIYTTAGDIARRVGDFARAWKFYQTATAILSKIFSDNPANAGASERLAATYNSIGNTQLRRHNFAAARIAFRQALALAEPIASSDHSNAQAFYTTADAYAGLGEVESSSASNPRQTRISQRKHWDQALSSYRRSLQFSARIKEPGFVSPDGFDCVSRESVTRRLAEIMTITKSSSAALRPWEEARP